MEDALVHESGQRKRNVRACVNVHSRGPAAAKNMAVKDSVPTLRSDCPISPLASGRVSLRTRFRETHLGRPSPPQRDATGGYPMAQDIEFDWQVLRPCRQFAA